MSYIPALRAVLGGGRRGRLAGADGPRHDTAAVGERRPIDDDDRRGARDDDGAAARVRRSARFVACFCIFLVYLSAFW